MDKWKKKKAVHLVWVSDKFREALPDDVKEMKTYHLLSNIYDMYMRTYIHESGKTLQEFTEMLLELNTTIQQEQSDDDAQVPDSDAETDRASERQLKQHLLALLLLTKAAETPEPLSEELIMNAHKLLMKDLCSEGERINAGEYRTIPVHCGNHSFIDFECVPSSMKILIAEYNEKIQAEHDSFQLASWLLMQMLLIHPFQDGNGRVSRLLWYYSLLRDGLPFPVIPFQGMDKGYKKYRKFIERDSESLADNSYKHVTSLTLVSVTKTWTNFISNLKFECKEKHEMIIAHLRKTDNLLEGNDYYSEEESADEN